MNIVVMIVAPVSILLTVIFLFKYVWITESRTRSMAMNSSVLGLALLFLLIALEFAFRAFLIQPDGYSVTLCSQRWFSKYWYPINSYGYRDIEHLDLQGKRVLFIVGDSFVAGHGIEDIADRFSNVLAEKLGNRWEVINIARRGWDTYDEYHAIISYPHKPDAIILSYYYNDIEGTMTRTGFGKPVILRSPPQSIQPLVEHSYLFNFSYWIIYRYRYGEDLGEAYMDALSKAFSSESIWNAHKNELFNITRFAEENAIRLIVVVFPNLYDMESSEIYTTKIVKLLRSRKIMVIDLADILAGRDPQELIVNRIDTHPSVELNREIGALLYEYIR